MGKQGITGILDQLRDDVRIMRDSRSSVADAIEVLANIDNYSDGVQKEVIEVEEALETVVGYYKNKLGLGNRNFNLEFFRNPKTVEVGKLMSAAWTWLYGDDLITVPDAACLLIDGLSREVYTKDTTARTYMHNFFERVPKSNTPYLTLYYIDPTVKGRRVRRSEVLALRESKEVKGNVATRG